MISREFYVVFSLTRADPKVTWQLFHFQERLQMFKRFASRRKSSLSTKVGDNLFLFASIISPAALKSLSTAVEVAGGVRYLLEKDRVKEQQQSYSPFGQRHKGFACRTLCKECCLILFPPSVNCIGRSSGKCEFLYLRQAVSWRSE